MMPLALVCVGLFIIEEKTPACLRMVPVYPGYLLLIPGRFLFIPGCLLLIPSWLPFTLDAWCSSWMLLIYS